MELMIFSVRDSKAEAFITPFFAPTIAVASRMFETACNDQATEMFKHSDDYTLYHVGLFDQNSGSGVMLESPVALGLATTFIKGENS